MSGLNGGYRKRLGGASEAQKRGDLDELLAYRGQFVHIVLACPNHTDFRHMPRINR